MSRKSRVSAAVVGLMADGERHAWTLEELHADLADRGVATDFSTVFRSAEKLAGEGVLRKLLLNDGRARFELLGAHHDHLYCTRCHDVVPIPCVIGHQDFSEVERVTGAVIFDHRVVLSGLCRNCRAADAALDPAGSGS